MRVAYNRKDLSGQRFGRLVVADYAFTKSKRAYWNCKCDCGGSKVISGHQLVNDTKSCGCIKREQTIAMNTKHGCSKTKYYPMWRDMNNRCFSENNKYYYNYGGRGVTVCEEWIAPEEFIKWCEKQEPIPEGYSLDREDVNGDYSPDNCRFASVHTQNRNKRTNVIVEYNRERLCFKDFVAKYGVVPYEVAKGRVRVGWDKIEAARTPK